jgi:hypothetical protein
MEEKLKQKLKSVLEDIDGNRKDGVERLENFRDDILKSFDEAISSIDLKTNVFEELQKRREEMGKMRIAFWKSFFPINWKYILSAPFIYGMFIPLSFLHICLEIYHQIGFRLYGIPRVNPREFFFYDRNLLPYLNPFQKFNCFYCSYANCLLQYAVEVSARTERYWCPIKYAHKIAHGHSQYPKFIDYLDAEHFNDKWDKLRKFEELDKDKK